MHIYIYAYIYMQRDVIANAQDSRIDKLSSNFSLTITFSLGLINFNIGVSKFELQS